MKKYEANIPQDFSVLIEDPHCLSINGWLASDGILYACRWRQHKSICKALDITTEAQMERAGYIKLTNMNWLLEDRYTPCKLTPEQITTIKRWYESNELSMDSYNHLKKHWSSE
jgi:hypothetical protein